MSYKLKLNPEITVTDAEEGVVLFSKKTGTFFGLNAMGYDMLTQLEHMDLDSLSKKLAALYEAEEMEIAQDIADLIQELESKKLVHRI